MNEKGDSFLTRIYLGRFSLLLVSVILTFALRPFLEGFLKINILTDVFMSVIILSAIYTVSEKRGTFLIALALAFPVLILKWLSYMVSSPSAMLLEDIFGTLFTAYLLIFILSFISRQTEVTGEVIMAALCGYFFLGLMWASIYLFLESMQPGSFQIARNGMGDHTHFIYFSFVTMTTLGYGDTIPLSNAARNLSVLEATMGQLYLAVTIAGLVGIHIAQSQQKRI